MGAGLQGKIAIVTGSARGIGRATAEKLIANGATVVLSDILREQGEESAKQLGPAASFMTCDISSRDQVESLIGSTVQRFGRLDVMVNNAGINTGLDRERVNIDKFLDETWHRILNVDLTGTFYCCRAAAAQMVKQHSGSIVNISSVAGVVALRLQIAFCAAKAAILKLTEAMVRDRSARRSRQRHFPRLDRCDRGPSVRSARGKGRLRRARKLIASFIPQGRLGAPGEIADAVLFLASDTGSYVNGHNLVVDGGWTCGFNRDW